MAYISTDALKLAVNKLALDTMLPIYADYLDLDDDQLAKRNAFAAIYNDGVRCFADRRGGAGQGEAQAAEKDGQSADRKRGENELQNAN